MTVWLFSPRFHLHLGKDGDSLVILIGGGTKRRKQQDIAMAKERWTGYKRRKRREIQ
jgi:putative component of toxin-antitoxin plasmid stabilization module